MIDLGRDTIFVTLAGSHAHGTVRCAAAAATTLPANVDLQFIEALAVDAISGVGK